MLGVDGPVEGISVAAPALLALTVQTVTDNSASEVDELVALPTERG